MNPYAHLANEQQSHFQRIDNITRFVSGRALVWVNPNIFPQVDIRTNPVWRSFGLIPVLVPSPLIDRFPIGQLNALLPRWFIGAVVDILRGPEHPVPGIAYMLQQWYNNPETFTVVQMSFQLPYHWYTATNDFRSEDYAFDFHEINSDGHVRQLIPNWIHWSTPAMVQEGSRTGYQSCPPNPVHQIVPEINND